MNTRYIWILGIVVVVVIVAFVVWPKGGSPVSVSKSDDAKISVEPNLNPLIKLSGGMHATSTSADGTNVVTIKSGDFLTHPVSIELAKDTRGTIYFADGSEARLIEGTKLKVDSSSYNRSNQELNVEMTVSSGHVWSKIIELATPKSSWEVKTSNAVATVRGTAFDVSVLNGKTSIAAASHRVAVAIVDPKTKNVLAANVATVNEGKILEIGDKEILAAKKESNLQLVPVSAPVSVIKGEWATSNMVVDATIDQKVESLKKEGVTGGELRDKLRETVVPKAEVTPAQNSVDSNKNPEGDDVKPKTDNKLPLKNTEPIKEPVVVKPAPQKEPAKKLADPIRIEVDSTTPYAVLSEGDQHTFRATLFRSDGTKEDVTDKATWQVVGAIGSFSSPGKFVAKLDAQGEELGEQTGTVAATWIDSASDQGFLGKSPMFKVKFNPGQTNDRAI